MTHIKSIAHFWQRHTMLLKNYITAVLACIVPMFCYSLLNFYIIYMGIKCRGPNVALAALAAAKGEIITETQTIIIHI